MLERRTRAAVLELREKGLGTRAIARALSVSRGAVKRVVAAGTEEPAEPGRASSLSEHWPRIEELMVRCPGNLVRVHEELQAEGVTISYPALTAYVRSRRPPEKTPAGRYHFPPGHEIQHDTSPHDVELLGKTWRLQTASAVLCSSRMLFFQLFWRFTRLEAKTFLTAAFRFFAGVTERVMVDNTSVIRLRGTGADMEPAPEMAAFAERFGFAFVAHAVGNVNRSARVERPFSYIEGNFLNGRTFTDLEHLNREALAWCQTINATHKRSLGAAPQDLYALERPHLKPLPVYIPEPEQISTRTVDVEGFVSVDTNRYSVPAAWIHRQVQVRLRPQTLEIDHGKKTVTHTRVPLPLSKRILLDEHRVPRGDKARLLSQLSEERDLSALLPGIEPYVSALKKKGRRAPLLLLRRLVRMAREYPHDALRPALDEALRFGLFDLDRLERMVLARIRSHYFRLQEDDDE